jgi:hypothetical protein
MQSASELIMQWAEALGHDDLLLINNALNEIINGSNAIDESEFQARTGVEREHAREVLAEVNELFQKAQAVRGAN